MVVLDSTKSTQITLIYITMSRISNLMLTGISFQQTVVSHYVMEFEFSASDVLPKMPTDTILGSNP